MYTEHLYQHVFALDCETGLISAENGLAPPWVCLSAAWRDERGEICTGLWGSDEEGRGDALHTLRSVLEDDDVLIRGARLVYDLGVLAAEFEELLPLIFEKLAKGLCECVQLNEKLLNLSTHGRLKYLYAPDGTAQEIKYHLDVLESKYFGGSRADQKKGEDAWRLNYIMLKGLPAADYPVEARDYAIEDAVGALLVGEAQEERQRTTHGTFFGSRARCAFDFAYHLVSLRGIEVDQDYVDHMKREVERLASPENLPLLVDKGLLTPPQPPRPHKRNKDHVPGCNKKGCNCPPVMCAPQPEKLQSKKLKAYVAGLCLDHVRDIKLTDSGQKKLKVKKVKASEWESLDEEGQQAVIAYTSTAKEVVAALAPLDPVVAEFQRRQSIQKIAQENKRIDGALVCHPQFDTLKETTRVSSYGSDLLPSRNIQQVPNRLAGMDPRYAHKPREGFWFIDADYDALELCNVAQVTHNLFKNEVRCVHFEKINKGWDLHAFLGSQLALRKSQEFQQALRMMGAHIREDDVYHAFQALKDEGSQELSDLYKHWRTFAKPVGLGYPGGLGPATMSELAAKQYGVVMTVDEAGEVREFWRETYEEMPLYFEWCNEQIDEFNEEIVKADDDLEDDDQGPSPAYWYMTPLGVTRRGARFCALANGKAMQSPAAEGFNIAMFNVQRACYDWTTGSPLYGCGVVAPIHDQIVVEVPADLDRARAAAAELKKLMVQGMKVVCPDVRINADPILCSRWSKSAELKKDEAGQLVLWSPETLYPAES